MTIPPGRGQRGRQGTSPRIRIAPPERLSATARQDLADRLTYVGSALHKTRPADYGFHPPVNPRPWKSICDGGRAVPRAAARNMFRAGILRGMVSDFADGEVLKYVWCVDAGEVYAAKISPGTREYKGYRLEEEDAMRSLVLKEWDNRCSPS